MYRIVYMTKYLLTILLKALQAAIKEGKVRYIQSRHLLSFTFLSLSVQLEICYVKLT